MILSCRIPHLRPPQLVGWSWLVALLVAAAPGSPAAAATTAPLPPPDPGSRQATGIRMGEVTDHSARIWTRITAATSRLESGPDIRGGAGATPDPLPDPARLRGACSGAPGRVRIRFEPDGSSQATRTTPWVAVTAATDFSHCFVLDGLRPDTVYRLSVETAGAEGEHAPLTGWFRTAPEPEAPSAASFCVITGQMFKDLDHEEGFRIYPAMLAGRPDFAVFTGDNVYYDNEAPQARTPALARYHWERMYSLPRHVEFLRQVPVYWEKDDHDVLKDDCWPGQTLGELTFAEGQALFRQQTPVGNVPYRTFRWGRTLQVWLTEGRDFRSPNTQPDGPDKTIWGREQWAWLQSSIRQSDATWKVLISPTPIVGPDRSAKNDNHANRGFRNEGDRIRRWFTAEAGDRFFIACGDRHWQYHSVDPGTGLQEFSCGPASDEHAGGSPGEDAALHRFHRVQGGFLRVEAAPGRITFRLCDVNGVPTYVYTSTRR